jgi:hypothetical protein
VTAIGKAIGNVAAHETGHEISYKMPLLMDCGGTGAWVPCKEAILATRQIFSMKRCMASTD